MFIVTEVRKCILFGLDAIRRLECLKKDLMSGVSDTSLVTQMNLCLSQGVEMLVVLRDLFIKFELSMIFNQYVKNYVRFPLL